MSPPILPVFLHIPPLVPFNLMDSCGGIVHLPSSVSLEQARLTPPARPSSLPRAHSAALSLPTSPSLHRRRPSTGRSAQHLQRGYGTSSRSYARSAPRKLRCSRRTPAVCPPPPLPSHPLPSPPLSSEITKRDGLRVSHHAQDGTRTQPETPSKHFPAIHHSSGYGIQRPHV